MLSPEREKEIMERLRFIGDQQEVNELFAEIDKLRANLQICKHPRCACVCGHKQQCPEDGPSLC